MFSLTAEPIVTATLLEKIPTVGAVVTFEGRVRDHNLGRRVTALEYEAYEELACREGQRILSGACSQFPIIKAVAVHRFGKLSLTDIAVSVVVAAAHRDAAFSACRFIIDEIKSCVPIWKKEYYASGETQWVDCPACRSHTSTLPTDANSQWL